MNDEMTGIPLIICLLAIAAIYGILPDLAAKIVLGAIIGLCLLGYYLNIRAKQYVDKSKEVS